MRAGLALAAATLCLLADASVAAPAGCAGGFIEPQARHAYNEARPASTPFPLPTGVPLPAVTYKPNGEDTRHTLEEYLGLFCTTGLLVLHDDQVVFERYLQGTRADTHRLSASMSKTLLALLIGIAIDEHKLSLDDRVVDVLPDFAHSAFADDRVEDLMRMASGVALVNSYEPGADSDNRAIDPMISPREDMRAYLRAKTATHPAGHVFDYNGVDTALLGLMLRERVGTPLTDYLERKLWQPMGAESAGYWIKNFRGQEGVQGMFSATLRDYARLGLLVMNQGRVGDVQVVPADWIARMTALRRDKPQPPNGPPWYGLQVWIPQAAGGRAFFWGVNGQNIFVDPVARMVIVHTGNSPRAGFDGNPHLFALRDAIAKTLREH